MQYKPTVVPAVRIATREGAERHAIDASRQAEDLLERDFRSALLIRAVDAIPGLLGARGITGSAGSTAAVSNRVGPQKAPGSAGGGAAGADPQDVDMGEPHLGVQAIVGIVDAPDPEELKQHFAATAVRYNVAHRIDTIRPLTPLKDINYEVHEWRKSRNYAQKVSSQAARWTNTGSEW